VAFSQQVSLSMTPPLTFGNEGAPVPHKLKQLNFAEHSHYIFGDQHAHANHLAQEAVFLFWNFAQYSGLGGLDIDHILTSMTFQNHAGESIYCDPLPFHPIKDAAYVQSMRHLFNNHQMIASRYHIGITKHEYHSKQQLLKSVNQYQSDNEVCFSFSKMDIMIFIAV